MQSFILDYEIAACGLFAALKFFAVGFSLRLVGRYPQVVFTMFKRAIVFIDGNNLYGGLRDCYGIERLDLEPFCKYLIQNRQLVAIYYADANFIRERGEDNYNRQQAYF